MKFAAFIPLAGCILNLLLGIFVYSTNRRLTINRVFFVWALAIAIWNAGSAALFMVTGHDAALFWARFLQFGVIFIPVLLFHLSMLVAHVRVKSWIWVLYVGSGLFALSNFTPFFIKDVRMLGSSGWYAVAGPGFRMFSTPFTAMLIISIIILWRRRKALPALHRTRLNALIWPQTLLVAFGTNDILPIMDIDKYPFTNITVYPYGSLAAIFYGIIVSYSVLQHQLLDIQVSLSRVVALFIRFSFLFVIGLAMLLTIALVAPAGQFTVFSFFAGLGVLMVSGVIASIFFPRLFGSGPEVLERRILGDRFEYHDQIRSFIGSMQWYTDTNLLLSDLDDLLVKTVRVGNYRIILRDETSRGYSLFRSYPEEPPQQYPDLHNDTPVFRFFEETKAEYLALNLTYGSTRDSENERGARKQIEQFGAEFCFPFSFEDQPFGLLVLGTKASGEPYTSTDITLLVSLVKHLSLVINQIRLKNQILHTQELELLGRMSRGMAHDLNNLLTPVLTFLQLASEGASLEDLNESLLPVALRNITTMRSYIREALFYSENLRPDLQLGRLDVLMGNAVDAVRGKFEAHHVNVTTETPGEVLVEMDEVLIQRTVANIISNAVDASSPNSTIRVELVRLLKTEVGREWLRVRVIDTGEGIKPEDLSRIFTPYFTTKDRGDQDRGFGLGLAICRKIIHLHGGTLTVTSKVKKGTTVQIDLPSRQQKPEAALGAMSLAS